MTNTAKVHSRFWDAMRARFGARWISEQGSEPSAPWVQLLDQYTPNDISAALALMSQAKREHPPTLIEFERLLKRAGAERNVAEQDWPRGYWRSCVISDVRFLMGYGYDRDRFEELVSDTSTLHEAMSKLVDDCVDMERRTPGPRTDSLRAHCFTCCQQIADGHHKLHKGS
jgi:hypothetical protein